MITVKNKFVTLNLERKSLLCKIEPYDYSYSARAFQSKLSKKLKYISEVHCFFPLPG